jgi:hypothetical protein
MTSEMVERVARELFVADNAADGHDDVQWINDTLDWERDEYRAKARAWMEAMREPTVEMVDAVYSVDNKPSCIRNHDVPGDQLRVPYKTMIDAA